MASYDVQTGGKLMDAQAVSVDGTVTDTVLNINGRVSFDIAITNTNLAGSYEVDGCNDIHATTPNWVALQLSTGATSVTIAAGTGAYNDVVDIETSLKYLRIKFNVTSGAIASATIVAHTPRFR